MFFLIQKLPLTFVKFHNYVYNSYSDTSPVLSSLLTAFSFEPYMPSNSVNVLVLIHFLVGWNTFLSNFFFKTQHWVAYFLSHFMSEKVPLSSLMNVDLAEFRILGSQTSSDAIVTGPTLLYFCLEASGILSLYSKKYNINNHWLIVDWFLLISRILRLLD